jgi:hypothetical protein
MVLLATLSGPTSDYDILEVRARDWPAIRFLRITTIDSPSWVAWREIEVLGS